MPALAIDVEARFAQFQDGLEKIQRDTKRAADSMSRSFDGVRSALSAIGLSLSVAGFAAFIKSSIDAGDELLKMSQKLGISVEKLSELQFAFKLANVDSEKFKVGMKGFELSLVEANDQTTKASRLFKALGVDIKAGPAEAFRQFAEAFSKLPEGALRAAVATEVLKKGGVDMIPALLGGAKALDDAGLAAQRLGIVISTDFAEQAAKFNDQMKILETRSSKLGISLTKELLPALNEITGKMADAAQQGRFWSESFQQLNNVVGGLIKRLHDFMGIKMRPDLERAIEAGFGQPAGQVASGRIKGGFVGTEAPTGKPLPGTPNAKDVLGALGSRAGNEAVTLFERTLQGLTKEYFNLTHEGRLAAIMWEEQNGTLKKLTPEERKLVEAMAKRIDATRNLLLIQTESGKRIESEFIGIDKAKDATLAYAEALRQESEELRFQGSLFGKGANEIEQMTAARKIDLDLRQRINALGEGQDDNPVVQDAIEQMRKGTDKQKAIFAEMIADRQRLDREWTTGANAAFMEYIDHATNAAEQSKNLFANAFKGIEDALVDFTMTGKLNFKSLADSIISDLVRIEVKASITGPLAAMMKDSGGLSGIFGKIFGGGNILSLAGGTDYIPRDGFAFLHKGEAVTSAGGGGDTYVIDARGADSGGMARLEALIAGVNGSIERRAIGAVRAVYNARGRTTPMG